MRNVNSNIAYDYIRKSILEGEYPPGAPLMTKDLAAKIGVSRTPVRDALRQLETDGLVTIRPHLGARVKKMSIKEFREMSDLRLALETYTAGLAARNRTEADLQEIGFALKAMRKLSEQIIASKEEQPLLSQLVREDVRFHIAIITAARSSSLKREILRLHLINRVVSGPADNENVISPEEKMQRDEHRREVMESHDEIYQAIAKGDSAAAKDAMERHIQGSIDSVIALFARRAIAIAEPELTEDELAYLV